jgi:hypothetical protein
MDDVFRAIAVTGGLVAAVGVVVVLMAWGGLDERMPMQVPPRRFARYAFAAGGLLIAIGAVGLAVPGG